MVLKADLVSEAVCEVPPKASVLYQTSCCQVYLGKAHTGPDDGLCCLVRAAHRLVHLELSGRGLCREEGARHVGTVPPTLAAHIKEDHLAWGERRVVWLVVGICGVHAKAHDGLKRVVVRSQPSILVE